jgi:hypothetical protein
MEALATLLAARVATALPFLDRVTGLARLLTKKDQDGEAPITVKLPIPVSFTAEECDQNDRYLTPDASTVGIAFFEDGGTQRIVNQQTPSNLGIRQTNLRLLIWVNVPLLDGDLPEAVVLAALERALRIHERYNAGDFAGIYTTYTTLPAEASLFGRYSFATETPLLFPPYRLIGLDLRVQYSLTTACQTQPLPGVKEPAVC